MGGNENRNDGSLLNAWKERLGVARMGQCATCLAVFVLRRGRSLRIWI